jgi:circadian clock protein KaiC
MSDSNQVDGRIQFREDGQIDPQPEDSARSKTGISGLDEILRGGLPTSHVFLVEGEPGTGKTTLGLQFLLEGAKHQQPVMYITLSESEREIRKVGRSHGWTLDGVSIFEYTATEDMLHPEEQYSVFYPSEIELQDTTHRILQEVEKRQPLRVVFDSLSEIRLLAREPLRYRRQVLALKQFFANRNCTVMLLDDLTGAGEDQQLRSIAHGVLAMEMLPRDFGIIRRRMRVAKLRGSSFREGYHDYMIRTGGVTVFPRLVSAEHREPFTDVLITSGISALDQLWGGGIRRGSSTLIVGPSGVGKSSLTMAYATSAARSNNPAHLFLFDENIRSAVRRADQLGLDPQPLLERRTLHMEQVDPAEISPGEFVHRVRDSVEHRGTKMVVLDSLNGLMASMSGEEHLILHTHELLSYLNQRGVATFLVLTQAGVLGAAVNSSIDLSYLSDNMLLVRHFEAGGEVRKAVSVVKNRGGEHESTIRELSFANSRINVGPPLQEFQGVLTGVPSYRGRKRELQERSGGERGS